ncbi:MAG: ABC transporter permease [Melioribacteraceae bacterium]|nr:ABC transporter permease [Melioribacteraceae bacterium]
MLKNHILVAIRNLKKHKVYSFINIVGLSVGIAVCILMLMFVWDEFSYDTFHTKSDRIFRVVLDVNVGGNELIAPQSPAVLGETLLTDYPEVEQTARIRRYGNPLLSYKDKVFSEDKFFRADSTIFDVFTFEFVSGNPKTALSKPNFVVLTERMAKKYFGSENPVGKMINADNYFDYMVTGVVKEFPSNSHFHFDFLLSLSSENDSRSPVWVSNNFYTYVVLREGSSVDDLNNKMKTDLVKYIAPQLEEITGIGWEQQLKQGLRYHYQLRPMKDIHLYSNLNGEIEPNSSITYVYIFLIIAFGILIIACINFMNLATARASGRAKEVGIRKTLGSSFQQLIKQFIAESIITSTAAVLLAVFLVALLLPLFNELSGKQLTTDFFASPVVLPSLLFFTVLIGIAAGGYPAFFLASFQPVAVLNGKVNRGAKGKTFRSLLVIFQFTLSIILIIGTFIVHSQLKYIQNKNLGYDKNQLLIVKKTDDIGSQINSFKTDLLRIPTVLSASNTNRIPGDSFGGTAYRDMNSPDGETHILATIYADYDFVDTYGMSLKEGRYYSKDRAIDTTNSIVINEAAARILGLKNPLNEKIINLGTNKNDSRMFNVIGVIKDFNFESLHSPIRGLAIHLMKPQRYGSKVTIRVAADNITGTVESIKKIWSDYAGNQAFEYTFFDEDFARLYKNEMRTGRLFTSFSVLAVIIACLGLFGMAAYTTEQRKKEIGIRKVLGANSLTILLLLSKEFSKWILISNFIAFPVSYLLMNKWLQNFEYKTEINLWIFIISGLIALIIAVLTVSSHSVKAALSNPVKSLKYE